MKTVADYQNDIQVAQREIEKLQASCLHNQGYDCVMYSWRPGTVFPTRLCKLCKIPMAGITPEEEQKATEWANGTITITNQEVS